MTRVSVKAICIKITGILRLTVSVMGGVEQFFIFKRECLSHEPRILVTRLDESVFVNEIARISFSLIAQLSDISFPSKSLLFICSLFLPCLPNPVILVRNLKEHNYEQGRVHKDHDKVQFKKCHRSWRVLDKPNCLTSGCAFKLESRQQFADT